ncbi:hypothetical protein [Microbulbifer sp. TRSA007]|uniref:hypothetical protein n=1 Tax=Microbulbifer sp. TRSA007 TaxID=3243384 RepID=UPI004039D35B
MAGKAPLCLATHWLAACISGGPSGEIHDGTAGASIPGLPQERVRKGASVAVYPQRSGLAGAILTHAKECARNMRVPVSSGEKKYGNYYYQYEGSGFLALSICFQANTLSQVQFSQFATRLLLFLFFLSFIVIVYCCSCGFGHSLLLLSAAPLFLLCFAPLIVSCYRAFNSHLFLLLAVFNFCTKSKALSMPTFKNPYKSITYDLYEI